MVTLKLKPFTVEQCQRPLSVSPGDLLLVLDAPSARAEGTVVWNVIGKHRRSRNTCNVKSGRFPVHLGLDHAEHALQACKKGVSHPSSWYEYTHNTRYVHMKRYVMGVGLFHGSMKKIH